MQDNPALPRTWQGLAWGLVAVTLLMGVAGSAAVPFSVQVQVEGAWRTATPPVYDAQGVPYVSLSSTARQLGAVLNAADGRCRMDFLGKSAAFDVNGTQVRTTQGMAGLRHPVLEYESDVLIAQADLNAFLSTAFSAVLPSSSDGAKPMLTPLQQPLQKPLQPSAQPEAESPEPETPEESEQDLLGQVSAQPKEGEAAPTAAEGEARATEGEHAPIAPGTITVVLDPGHGGSDPGCLGPAGTAEKDLALVLAQRVRLELKDQPGLRVVTTRDDDRDVALRNRMNFASVEKAALIVSLHSGASYSPQAQGLDIFIPQTPAAESGAAKTAQENAQASVNAGLALAEALAAATGTPAIAPRTVPIPLFENLATPGVLIETGFLTTPNEEQMLRTEEYQQKIARGIAQGLLKALGVAPQEGTKP